MAEISDAERSKRRREKNRIATEHSNEINNPCAKVDKPSYNIKHSSSALKNDVGVQTCYRVLTQACR